MRNGMDLFVVLTINFVFLGQICWNMPGVCVMGSHSFIIIIIIIIIITTVLYRGAGRERTKGGRLAKK